MRNANIRRWSHRSAHNNTAIIWAILAIVVAIFVVIKIFGSGSSKTSTPETNAAISITPMNEDSTVYITAAGGTKKKITETTALYTSDESSEVSSGGATAKLGASTLDMDESSQISYAQKPADGANPAIDTIRLTRGRMWVASESENLYVEAQNLTARVPTKSIAIVETTVAFGVVYAIQGTIDISTNVGQYSLKAGEKLLLGNSDAANAQTKLSEHVGPIDGSVAMNQLFARNDGENILKQATAAASDEPDTTASGSTDTETSTSDGKYISISQPLDGSTIKTDTITIMGTLLDTSVSRVTLNDTDTSVSPVNQTFVMQDFKLTGEINNIVYKVYDANNTRLEMGVLVVYGPKNASAQNTIVPQNYPISSADFVITAPNKNPYATTDSYVRVQGTVPKNTVKYITVNDYRLQKFVPNSETWYYHANAAIGTIKEGTNLYYIKFYDASDKLLYTQLFTIIKDSKNATTPASGSDESPLFPAQ